MSSKGCLIGIGYSPWTEKARWALDHHRIPYFYREHIILLGMPELRWRTGFWLKPLTVPAFVANGMTWMDSWEIAQRAEQAGKGAKLFPIEHLERITRYNELSEKAIEAGRLLFSARLMKDRQAQADALPSFIPSFLRSALTWVAQVGVIYVSRAFGFSLESAPQALADLKAVWTELDRDLKTSGGQYLLGGQLTYADIAMAVTLFSLEPAAEGPKLSPALKRCWEARELQSEFAGLLKWRDVLYQNHRLTGGSP